MEMKPLKLMVMQKVESILRTCTGLFIQIILNFLEKAAKDQQEKKTTRVAVEAPKSARVTIEAPEYG